MCRLLLFVEALKESDNTLGILRYKADTVVSNRE